MTDKALKILQELESEYGSVANVLEGNPKLTKLQFLVESEHRDRCDSYNEGKKQKSVDFLNDIIKYRNKGYSPEQIAEATGRSDSYTRHIMKENGIEIFPVYKYSVTDGTGNTMYFKNHREIIKETGISNRMIVDVLKSTKHEYKGFTYKAIRPIAVGLPPEVLIKKDGKWIRAKNL